MWGVDKENGNKPLLLYPVTITYGQYGRAKGIVIPDGRRMGFPLVNDNPFKTFLPEGSYTFIGPWADGSCNPNFRVKKP